MTIYNNVADFSLFVCLVLTPGLNGCIVRLHLLFVELIVVEAVDFIKGGEDLQFILNAEDELLGLHVLKIVFSSRWRQRDLARFRLLFLQLLFLHHVLSRQDHLVEILIDGSKLSRWLLADLLL